MPLQQFLSLVACNSWWRVRPETSVAFILHGTGIFLVLFKSHVIYLGKMGPEKRISLSPTKKPLFWKPAIVKKNNGILFTNNRLLFDPLFRQESRMLHMIPPKKNAIDCIITILVSLHFLFVCYYWLYSSNRSPQGRKITRSPLNFNIWILSLITTYANFSKSKNNLKLQIEIHKKFEEKSIANLTSKTQYHSNNNTWLTDLSRRYTLSKQISHKQDPSFKEI